VTSVTGAPAEPKLSLGRRLSFSRQVLEAIPSRPKEVVDMESCFGRQRTSIHEPRLLPRDGFHAMRQPQRLKQGRHR